MNNKKWFKRRRYGWGWYPVTGEGWMVTVLYMLGVTLLGIQCSSWMFPGIAALTLGLLIICMKKGPAPRWRWGVSAHDNPDDDF
jgi:hypothetical protein